MCPNGKIGDCRKLEVVYQLECLNCGATYIGETSRTLHVRAKEQMTGMRDGNLSTLLGKHKFKAYNGENVEIKCVILAYGKEISARKALEAAQIHTKFPAMNSKNERISVI